MRTQKMKKMMIAALATFLPLCGLSAADHSTPPNIVFILADDLVYGELGCYGAIKVKTPNLDRLAAEGLCFTDAHTPNAVCTPTRYALLTGRYCWRTHLKRGVAQQDEALLIDPDRYTLPKLFKANGYATACIGKWHLGLTLRHAQAEMVRAVMEGVIFACYAAFRIVSETGPPLERIILAGEGARSRLWQQIVADVFGVSVLPLMVSEQSGIGAALLAGTGTGVFELCEMVRGWADYNPPVEPSLENHKFYQEKISIFRDAYVKHKDDFRKL